ncbi:phospholipase D-like domain-containing protein [Pseudomonas sp. RT4P38]
MIEAFINPVDRQKPYHPRSSNPYHCVDSPLFLLQGQHVEVISNHWGRNHLSVVTDLINNADKIVICSGWIKQCGVDLLVEHLAAALGRGTEITIFTNAENTARSCIPSLATLSALRHVVVPKKFRLHTKLYYFESDTRYAAIVGSANITAGGLVHNDELSTVHHGTVGDVQHEMFNDYLEHLVARYKP